ncbi:ESX secretion-associated protein EspG [Saccharopolyspora sp. NPDC002686]
MTAATARRAPIEFGQVELDLLATHAGVPLPFPLRVPSFGRIAGEREVLLATAGRALEVRGFADESGPVGAAAEVVNALHQHRGTVDLVLADGSGATAVVAIVYRSWALICVQPLDGDPAQLVRMQRVPADSLTDALLELVPDVAPARTMPITLPERAVATAAQLISEIEEDREKERRLRELVRDCGGDPDALDQLAGLLPALTGRGQVGATRRGAGGSSRAGAELSWLDGPRGRVRVAPAKHGWVSVNPMRHNDLRFAVEDLARIAREPR